MLCRLASFLVLVWIIGLFWFSIALPRPAGTAETDAVVVYTGGEGRIARGLEVLREKWAPRMLVSGVDREVRPAEFAAEYDVGRRQMACCITLGFDAYDTRSNALEASRWLARNDYRAVRLVTTDWHMRRAALELDHAIPVHVLVIRDAVSSEPSLRILFLEYHKLILRRLSWIWDG